MMRLYEVELEVGQTLQIGGKLVTVIDVEGGEVSLRVEDVDVALEGLIDEEFSAVPHLPR